MNILAIEKDIKSITDRLALGCESTEDFIYGYLSALLKHKIIDRKTYNILKKVYCWGNEDCLWFINSNGELEKDKS